MRLVLLDLECQSRQNFYPLALNRPIWELWTGMTTLGAKLAAAADCDEVVCFVPQYMAAAYRQTTTWVVNDLETLAGDDLFLVNPRLRSDAMPAVTLGPSELTLSPEGEFLFGRVTAGDAAKLAAGSIEQFVAAAVETLATTRREAPTWRYTWELMLDNGAQLTADFTAAGRSGVEAAAEEPLVVRGGTQDVYVAPTATLHPMVVIDATDGPVYIDEHAEIHPFTRIEGPCYVGVRSVLLGAKCRAGTTIGPACRVGGEVEQSILLGYSNKYHDGFLGHAVVGQWVNLGAMTSNSHRENDYSDVSVILDGRQSVATGSKKVGALIGDHTRTSIGVLLNTGAYVGAMAMLLATGGLLPKFVPSFTWLADGRIGDSPDRQRLYDAAQVAMGRRNCTWTDADRAMWEAIFEQTASQREAARAWQAAVT